MGWGRGAERGCEACSSGVDDSVRMPFRLAQKIVCWAFLLLSGLAAGLIGVVAWLEPQQTNEVATLAFNAIVPVVATWVGAIITFYFSADSIKTATSQTLRALGKDNAHLAYIPVTAAMVSRSRMMVVTLPANSSDPQPTIKELLDLVKAGVTRFPVLNADGTFNSIIHQSLLYKYLATAELEESDVQKNGSKGGDGSPGADGDGNGQPDGDGDGDGGGGGGGGGGSGVDAGSKEQREDSGVQKFFSGKPLKDLLESPSFSAQIRRAVFVGQDSDLAAAKTKMDAAEGVQDCFVTATGLPSEKVLGWVTNVKIERFSRVDSPKRNEP